MGLRPLAQGCEAGCEARATLSYGFSNEFNRNAVLACRAHGGKEMAATTLWLEMRVEQSPKVALPRNLGLCAGMPLAFCGTEMRPSALKKRCQLENSSLIMAGMNFREKIISWDTLPAWRKAFRASGRKLVVTNGCFDLLHMGHVTYLETARNLGDALLVGVNGDDAVRALKGSDRPLNDESDRASVLAALQSVDGVCIFAERTATRFLSIAQPDIYVIGGDYTVDTLNKDERKAVEEAGGRIVIIPFVSGKSTTGLLAKIARL